MLKSEYIANMETHRCTKRFGMETKKSLKFLSIMVHMWMQGTVMEKHLYTMQLGKVLFEHFIFEIDRSLGLWKGKSFFNEIRWFLYVENERITQILIDRGADVNARNARANTPLHYAVIKSNYFAKWTLEIRSETIQYCNVQLRSFLSDCRKVARILINNGADVQSRNDEGETPRDIAMKNSNILEIPFDFRLKWEY